MTFRKFKADKIFDGYRFWQDHVLLVSEEGTIEGLLPAADAGNDAQILQGILSPGLINCHCHLELSHMKGLIPGGTGLVDFVFKVVTDRHFSEGEILDAIAGAEEEMLLNGIVAVGDICNNTFTIPQKQQQRIAYYNFIEASGWLPSVAEQRFERAKTIYERYGEAARSEPLNGDSSGIWNLEFGIRNSKPETRNPKPETPNCSIVPHAPYSVSEKLWEQIQPYFENKIVSIHNQETVFEDAFFLEGKGDFQRMYQLMKIDNAHHQPTKKTSLQSYFEKLENAANIILVHNTFTKQEDIDYVKRETSNVKRQTSNIKPATRNPPPHTFFCLCPNANLYIERTLPPIELLRRNDCNIVIGTDSLASNWSLNILDEIRTIQKSFPAIPLEEMLQWATINGARALRMDDVLGSFEKGKKPGLLLMNEEDLSVKIL